MKLFTIGYEDATQADLIERLKQAEVKVVVDVRAVAASRRAGFSKTVLAASLAEAGIGYVHLRPLGTPKTGRDAARAGRIGEMRSIFVDHLNAPPAQLAFEQLRELARTQPAALLCYEADHRGCHRSVLTERLQVQDGFNVVNL